MGARLPCLLAAASLAACTPGAEEKAAAGLRAAESAVAGAAGEAGWERLAGGLEVARLEAPALSAAAGATITVVRVDPARYRFSLLSAKLEKKQPAPTISEWVEQHGVSGAINASMYQADHLTSVGFLREGRRVNNGGWSRDKAVFVAEPLRKGAPPARLLDRSCEDARGIAGGYGLVAQSIRMLDCRGRNVWAARDERWSIACIGTDARGRVLLVHCRRPLRAHDLVDALLQLPLGVKRLMYVEGGPQAALHVRVGGRTVVSEVGRPAEGGL
ncbi:MAG TPA: phosphodiester glycosidase family protein, partial [Vicinamibacteria bacterium]|nr:phosphodiester glycosidase family protein [Vicinamibacteria bacterium]